jgi:hypothetical protein
MAEAKIKVKPFMTRLPLDVIRRAHIEAARSDTSVQKVITTALDKGLPKIRVVVDKD